ncbi:biotin/lipoyl-containing protein [Corynebacterium tuberculostearicum]|uniref:biotin/lipoyl-containing protein n=1 Tax=Corynebacterium tuberculostearicum TaxID=38304 RepID=UPI0026483769|nr:biotin/lipoyl-containing protein [Corynebacterium tuberculostearicum]WKE59570.1 acetyl-CoA carboxylase biotin carboxyl carrier protein subunit [Corynebacterium tuberculostearicum]
MKIYAPFAGIVRCHVAVGDTVDTGVPLATVEATKLEAPVECPGPGKVHRIAVADFSDVVGGDLLMEIGEA